MKKFLSLIVLVAFFGVAASAQTDAQPVKVKAKTEKVSKKDASTEKAAETKADACTKSSTEGKACCSKDGAKGEAKAEGSSCEKGEHKEGEGKSCCSKDGAKAEGKSCCSKDAGKAEHKEEKKEEKK